MFCDYIIPLCNTGGEDFEVRINTLNTKVLPKLKKDVHLILSEQRVNLDFPLFINSLKITTNNLSYHLAHYPNFNKSWLCNIGARYAITKNLVFADADIVFEDNFFTQLKSFWKNNTKWFIGWNQCEFLQETDQKFIVRDTSPTHGGTEGGLICFNKEFFFEIGGYNEWFQFLCGMDNEIISRAYHTNPDYKMMPYKILHIGHPPTKMKASYNSRMFNRNLYLSINDQIKQMLNILKTKYTGNLKEPLCVKPLNGINIKHYD